MRDAYIVKSIRTPGCKRSKGAFKDTRPEELLSFILSTAVEKTDNLAKEHVEDIMIGCSFPEAEDEVAFHSQMKAAEAKKKGLFKELIPTPAIRYVPRENGTFKRETFLQDFDDGIRESTTLEGLGNLRPAFAASGSVTAGNSSQMTDGAAATVIMSENKVKELGVKAIARFKYYISVGCRADEMGVGPRYAIPKLMKIAGMDLKDIELFEINEAFASQALYSVNELGIDLTKVNIHGGAIALGHPLGCTGAKLCATLLNNMQERGIKYGVESMCIGGGMGAAVLFERCE